MGAEDVIEPGGSARIEWDWITPLSVFDPWPSGLTDRIVDPIVQSTDLIVEVVNVGWNLKYGGERLFIYLGYEGAVSHSICHGSATSERRIFWTPLCFGHHGHPQEKLRDFYLYQDMLAEKGVTHHIFPIQILYLLHLNWHPPDYPPCTLFVCVEFKSYTAPGFAEEIAAA